MTCEANPGANRQGGFAGKTVMVVGAGRSAAGWSNGAAAARAYAREGARVACLDRDLAAAERTVQAIGAEEGSAVAYEADALDLAGLESLTVELIHTNGQIDVLHNNVGAAVMGGPVELSEADYHRALELNLGTVFRTCKVVIPAMLEKGGGAIVNVSSLAATRWTGYAYFAYAAAKAGVNQATIAIALQYARHGIRSNCVLPGAIETPMLSGSIAAAYGSVEAMRAARAEMVPMGRSGAPEDVAEAALFLASDSARFITGICLPVDGGQSCSARAFA